MGRGGGGFAMGWVGSLDFGEVGRRTDYVLLESGNRHREGTEGTLCRDQL